MYDSEPDEGPQPCGKPGPAGSHCGEYAGHENWGQGEDKACGNWFMPDGCTCGHPDHPEIRCGPVGQCPVHDTAYA